MGYYDPISDVTTEGSYSTGAAHYTEVDDAVRQPSDPGTATYVEVDFSDGAPATEEYGLTASSAAIDEITVWVNCASVGMGETIDVSLKIGASYCSNQQITTPGSQGWESKTFNSTSDAALFPISASTAINVRLQCTGAGPGTRNTLYAVYGDYTESAGGGGADTSKNILLLGVG